MFHRTDKDQALMALLIAIERGPCVKKTLAWMTLCPSVWCGKRLKGQLAARVPRAQTTQKLTRRH